LLTLPAGAAALTGPLGLIPAVTVATGLVTASSFGIERWGRRYATARRIRTSPVSLEDSPEAE
jgi:hypothetical protein